MLIDFFYTLRQAKLKVSVQEFLTLLEALKADAIAPSVDEFYVLARTILVKDEALFDKFDRAFAAYVNGPHAPSTLRRKCLWSGCESSLSLNSARRTRRPLKKWGGTR